MCAAVTGAVIMLKTSGDMPGGENEASQCSAHDITWKPRHARIALGSY